MKNTLNIDFERASRLSRAQLESLVSHLAALLDEHTDAIWLAAIDDEFLTPDLIVRFMKIQRFACCLHEAFAHGNEDFEL
jgi:hypothetical protein